MSREAMKLALEALELEQTVYLRTHLPVPEYLTKAITSLRQAIAEAEGISIKSISHPIGQPSDGDINPDSLEKIEIDLPKREWVGLTDEEIKEIIGPWGDTPIKGYTRKLFDQIEAKLRSKNT